MKCYGLLVLIGAISARNSYSIRFFLHACLGASNLLSLRRERSNYSAAKKKKEVLSVISGNRFFAAAALFWLFFDLHWPDEVHIKGRLFVHLATDLLLL